MKSLTFVITGTLSRPRSEVAAQIIRAGHQVGNSVNSQTDYLVVGSNPGVKLDKALDLDVTILPEKALRPLLDRHSDPLYQIEGILNQYEADIDEASEYDGEVTLGGNGINCHEALLTFTPLAEEIRQVIKRAVLARKESEDDGF